MLKWFIFTANFVLPETCAWLEEVIFAELDEEEARVLVEKYNREAAMYNSGLISGRSQSSRPSGPPSGPRRSRFDAGGGDRGRFSDRRPGPPGPMRHRNDRRGKTFNTKTISIKSVNKLGNYNFILYVNY